MGKLDPIGRDEKKIIEDAVKNASSYKFPRLIHLQRKRPSPTEVGRSPGYKAGIIDINSVASWIFMGRHHRYDLGGDEYVLSPTRDMGGMVENKCHFCSAITYVPDEDDIKGLNTICWRCRTDKGLNGRSRIIIVDVEFEEKVYSQVDMSGNSNQLRMTGIGPIMDGHDTRPEDVVDIYGLENPEGLLHGALIVEIIKQNTEKLFSKNIDEPILEMSVIKGSKDPEKKAREEAEKKAREEAEKKAREEAEKKAREEAEKKAREEAEKKAREESRKLKHFNEYKKRLKEYDLQKKYDAFKTMLKEKAVEDLKKTREGFDSVNIAKEDDIVHSAGQSIGDVEQQSRQMIEDAKQCVRQMIEDAKQCVRQMIEDAKLPKNIESEKIHAKELEEKNQVLLNNNKEKDDEVLKTESEKMWTKEKSRTKNIEYHKHHAADNTIIGAGLLTSIFEIISGLSKENKKCNNMILANNFYKKGYKNYEIYSALNLMEKENIIYKIIYVDWFIKERYRDNDIDATNKLWIDIFKIIKDFSKKYNWKYGIKRSDLYDELLKKDHLEADIGLALESMKKQDIIYNKTYIYWFTNKYKGHIKEEITEEEVAEEEVAEEDIIEFPRHAEEPKVEVPKSIIDTTALQTKVTTLESQNTALQTKVTTLESQNTALQTKVTTLESQIDEKIKKLNEEEENFRSAEHRYDEARQLDIKLMNEFYNAIREGVRIPSQHRVWTLRSPIATGNRDIIESEQKKANNAGFLTEIVEIIMVEKKSK